MRRVAAADWTDKRVALVVAALTLLRLVMAALTPVAPDEAYYWTWSQALAPGYLDHPPMVALWIAGGTALFGKTALGLRLVGPPATALASWALWDAGRRLFPGTGAGAASVLLLNATLFLGVGTVIMTPDTPLLVFWTLTLWAAARVAADGGGRWWLACGAFAGLALASKYTAAFLWIGLPLWVVAVPRLRPWLRRWEPYAGAALGMCLFIPVVWWNASRGWVGFLKQGGRVEDWHPLRAVGFLAELIGSQAGLCTPVVFVLCMIGFAACLRQSRREVAPSWSLLLALSAPPVLVFLQHAVGDRVQGNWPAIIYPALVLAAGATAAGRRWTGTAVISGMTITAFVYLQALTRVVPLPPRMDPTALQLAGWEEAAAKVEALASDQDAAFIAAENYGLVSELAWWLPGGRPVLGTDGRWSLMRLPTHDIGGQTGLLVHDARRTGSPDASRWRSAVPVGTIERLKAPGGGIEVLRVVAATGATGARLPQ